jgi:PAS domain S-box-containing protein
MKKKTHGKSPEAADSNFFEYASDGMAITDMHGNMIDANPACCAMLGYSRDEIISKKLPEFYPPEDLAAAPIHFKEASEGRIVRIGRRLIRRDGALIDVEIHGRMMPDGRLFATVRDMSAQKRAEEELKNSEAQLTTLFDNSPSAIAFVHKLVYVRVNDMYLAMFGYSKDELIGKTVLDVVPPECHPQVLQLIAKRRGGDKSPLHFTTKGRRKNGETFDLEIDSTVCTVGEKQFSIAHHRDLTVHKRTEEALNKAQKLEALGVLAGGIAHDFNNLMGGVFGFIDLARGCSKEPLVSEFLGKAMTGIERARSLTQQLLTFSKGGAPIRKVGHLFPCIKDAVQFALSGSSVSCDIDVQDNLHPCNFDENQITQVVDNIVINALHAMPLGGTIELAARNVAIGASKIAERRLCQIIHKGSRHRHSRGVAGPHFRSVLHDQDERTRPWSRHELFDH